MPVRSNELSFKRMFGYRAAGLGGYIAAFYILIADGLPGWVALVALVGVTIVITLSICHWREGEGWLAASGNALVMNAFCGVMPAMLIDDRRAADVSDGPLALFSLCASEAVFFLSELGVFGPTFADPVSAILASLTVLIAQSAILGFEFFNKRRG